ncbi:hypothetical protein pEaSNUABM22_00121 [Erwinia phage pEa_SNUABM_22]|uniref:Uncharacterized protein n=1 Tax=Erwinia phage pEa_SNUABM_22 TaxID=2869549 RepID=A0AAE9BUD1_9CAUD|nr:hypothetical protein MPK63_gp120 [Erwinia phage pEa_SNUABM_22]UAW96608.1 hypothetical protein pEaSNUABM22_00121 [Erwinia phage pEa_SNUABM_22]
MNLNLFSSMPKARQEAVLKKICEDNAFMPQFEQRFLTMALFAVRKSRNQNADVFSCRPTKGQHMAVGYRVQYVRGKYVAEPWCFVVPDAMKSIGEEINTRPDNSIYFGSIVPDSLIAQHGTLAYSLMLGNLNLLKQNAFRLVSY